MMSFSLEAGQAIEWTTRIAAFYVLLDSAEKLFCFREFLDGGLLNWKFLRRHYFFKSRTGLIGSLFAAVFDSPAWLFFLFLRVGGACYLLLFPLAGAVSGAALGGLFVIGSLANLRNAPFGAETENRFSLVIIGALFLRSLVPTGFVAEIVLWFIALQSCLSYVTAGISKLFNEEWRKGNGLFHVVNSPNLTDSPKLALFFARRRSLDRFLSWFNVGIECAFPLVFFVGQPLFILFLIWGAAFHLANAVLFRLNKFFWIWLATYPAIIFAAQ